MSDDNKKVKLNKDGTESKQGAHLKKSAAEKKATAEKQAYQPTGKPRGRPPKNSKD